MAVKMINYILALIFILSGGAKVKGNLIAPRNQLDNLFLRKV